jgi:hypothetical protein
MHTRAGDDDGAWDLADLAPAPVQRCSGIEEAEQFEYPWHYDEAPVASSLEQLAWRGYEPPDAHLLSDVELSEELERLARRLADIHVFLHCTDHLSDRELYTLLTENLLREEQKVFRLDPNVQCHLDVLGGCSDEDTRIWLKHYADEETRQRWARDFPNDEIPDHEPAPFDRGRRLPQPLF